MKPFDIKYNFDIRVSQHISTLTLRQIEKKRRTMENLHVHARAGLPYDACRQTYWGGRTNIFRSGHTYWGGGDILCVLGQIINDTKNTHLDRELKYVLLCWSFYASYLIYLIKKHLIIYLFNLFQYKGMIFRDANTIFF